MRLYRIEHIKLKPILVLAHNHDDAANILSHGFTRGMQNRPDADFEIVDWNAAHTDFPEPLTEWLEKGHRGVVWSVEDGAGWELVSTGLEEP